MLRSLIALPILARESKAKQTVVLKPEMFLELSRQWETEKQSEEHKAAIKRSEPNAQERLAVQLYCVKNRLSKAKMLVRAVEDGEWDFKDLSQDKQQMIKDYDARRGDWKLEEELLAEQAANANLYRGAGAVSL